MSDSQAWDARYDAQPWMFGQAPNRYLESLSPRLPVRGEALSLGDGEGRNGLFMARRGLAVTAVDWSATGMARASAWAAAEDVPLRTETADLTRWSWPEARFGLIAWIFLHLPPEERETVVAGALRALAPGGWLVLECFSPAQQGRRSGGPRDASLLWTRPLAERAFASLDVVECLEGCVNLDEGPKHQGPAEVVRGVWRKPG